MLASQSERSPRQTRHLSFISEFTSDIRHIKGKDNEVADALSIVEAITAQVDLQEMAREQAQSNKVQAYLGNQLSGLKRER